MFTNDANIAVIFLISKKYFKQQNTTSAGTKETNSVRHAKTCLVAKETYIVLGTIGNSDSHQDRYLIILMVLEMQEFQARLYHSFTIFPDHYI